MEDDVVIAKIRKSSVSEVWVTARTYAGKTLCDVREHFHPAESPDWLPTKKGVSIPKEVLAKAVDAAEKLASQDSVGDVAEIPRGRKAKLCFAVREYQKHIYGEIRTYYLDQGGGDVWKPGKGVTLPLSKLGPLAEALRLAEDEV